MIIGFRDQWLNDYYFGGRPSRRLPAHIAAALRRKLDILHAAASERDLSAPPGNRFEHLQGKLKERCSLRVNNQYRIIFQWKRGRASEIYLDPHAYR